VFSVLRLLDFQLEPNSTPKASRRGEHYFGHISTRYEISTHTLKFRTRHMKRREVDISSVDK